MKQRYFIANWKMNKTKNEMFDFFEIINLQTNIFKQNMKYLLALPLIHYSNAMQVNKSPIELISQDVSNFSPGSYTSQTSAQILKSYDINYSLVGHSETRKYQNVNDQLVNEKAKQCIENNIIPIICIGEDIEIYNNKSTDKFIKQQLEVCTNELDPKKIIIAYEPLWSIGTGLTPSFEQIQNIIELIKKINSNYVVIYGGSVNNRNINDILKIDQIDGILVGNASLNPQDYFKLVKNS